MGSMGNIGNQHNFHNLQNSNLPNNININVNNLIINSSPSPNSKKN